jgi:hypothetical protein
MSTTNLTPAQKEILQRIENEFLTLNNSEKKASLISKDFFDNERKEVDNAIKEIEVNNIFFKELVSNKIKEDIIKLNNDLDNMGLIATKYNDSIRIDIKGKENTNFPDFRFNYETKTAYEHFKDGRSIHKTLEYKGLEFYTNPNKKELFSSVEILCENTSFIDKVRELYNKVLKNT